MEINNSLGKKCWTIPDGYIPQVTENDKHNQDEYLSHECICILNTGPDDVVITLSIYFEDCDPVFVNGIVVAAQRSRHLRMDGLKIEDQPVIARGKPYSLVINSSDPVVVQMSRLDTTQNNMSFLSSMGFLVDEK
jgi:hypothetical protein